MYSLKAILQKQPVAIAGALKSLLFVAVLTGLLIMDEKLLAGIAISAELILNLFVWNTSTPTAVAVVNEAQAYAQGEASARGDLPSTPYGPPS